MNESVLHDSNAVGGTGLARRRETTMPGVGGYFPRWWWFSTAVCCRVVLVALGKRRESALGARLTKGDNHQRVVEAVLNGGACQDPEHRVVGWMRVAFVKSGTP